MKDIKPIVYESLTPRQRIIAAIEADARGDDAELERLKETCPKRTYKMTDAEYSMTMMTLMALSIAVECEIRNSIIGFMTAAMTDHDDAGEVFLQNIANTQAAWHETLGDMGIDPATMAKVTLPSPFVFEIISEFLPSPDPASVKLYRESLDGCLKCS